MFFRVRTAQNFESIWMQINIFCDLELSALNLCIAHCDKWEPQKCNFFCHAMQCQNSFSYAKSVIHFSKVRYASFTFRFIFENVMFCIDLICLNSLCN